MLAVPTIAMGGTLPAAARAVTRAGDVRRQDLATLYALNTLGAVAGCLIATFFLLEIYGTRATLWLAAARQPPGRGRRAARWTDAAAAEAADGRPSRQRADSSSSRLPASRSDLIRRPARPAAPLPIFLLVASGDRRLRVLPDGAGLVPAARRRCSAARCSPSAWCWPSRWPASASAACSTRWSSSDRPATLAGFAASLPARSGGGRRDLRARRSPGAAGAGAAAARRRRVRHARSPAGRWSPSIVVLPPAIVAGYQFPLLIALFGRGRDRVGRHVGLAYAANTAGAIVGSLAGGFGAAAVAVGARRVAARRHGAAGARRRARRSLSLRAQRPHGARHVWSAAACALVGASRRRAAARRRPARRPSGATAASAPGRAPRDVLDSPNQLRAWQHAERRAIVWDGDGVESSVALAVEQTGYAFIVNGKSDGSARGDAGTQVMLGLLGALRHPEPRRALVIGLGTGSTAGWLGAVPVDGARRRRRARAAGRSTWRARASAVNHDVLHNPKVHVTIGDARETLLTDARSLRRHRVGAVESVPRRHRQPLHASSTTAPPRDRLTDDGVFAQWVQGYEIDAPTLRTIYATMAAVFPQVETWQTNSGDLVLLAAKRPRRLSAPRRCARASARSRSRPRSRNAWRAVDLNGLLAHFLANDRLARAFADAAARRDQHRRSQPRRVRPGAVGRPAGADPGAGAAATCARAIGASRPPLDTDAGIVWPAVETAWANFVGWDRAVADDARGAAAGRAGAAGGAAALLRRRRPRRRARDVAAADRAAARSDRSWRWPRTSRPKPDRIPRCR